MQQDIDVSEATIRRFRNALGEEGYNEILKELLRIGSRSVQLKKRLGIGDYRYDCTD